MTAVAEGAVLDVVAIEALAPMPQMPEPGIYGLRADLALWDIRQPGARLPDHEQAIAEADALKAARRQVLDGGLFDLDDRFAIRLTTGNYPTVTADQVAARPARRSRRHPEAVPEQIPAEVRDSEDPDAWREFFVRAGRLGVSDDVSGLTLETRKGGRAVATTGLPLENPFGEQTPDPKIGYWAARRAKRVEKQRLRHQAAEKPGGRKRRISGTAS